jgi:phospholipase C
LTGTGRRNRDNRIQKVVIIVKENHCFDNYFGTFPGASGMVMERAKNPPPYDHSHTHDAWLNRKTKAARQQFTENDIPAYFAYGKQFTLCDNYFTDVAGPSTPNHLMLITADSPIVDNPSGDAKYNLTSLPANLENAGLTWKNYDGYAFGYIAHLAGKHKFKSEQFTSDASTGNLPNISYVYASHEFSEHPRGNHDTDPRVGNVKLGMQWTVEQVNAIVQGGLWYNSVIFITWDDWGGWYDHVDPPNLEAWNDGTQFRYGSRVGCLVLSPYAKSGYVSKVLHSHVSLVKFCESNFGLSPLNQRDSNADDMSDCFDFTQQPLDPPQVNP